MKKAIVAYFSAGGVTAAVGKRLAKVADAAVFEICPQKPYTNADLDWSNKKSRSSVEMQDRACRPALAEKVPDLTSYEVVFIGFPIWWYREPSIIDTFMESADFSGKMIVPFATSGGSGLGDAPKNIQALAPNAVVRSGQRFDASVSEATLSDWVKIYL